MDTSLVAAQDQSLSDPSRSARRFKGLPPCCVVAYDFSAEAERALHLALVLHRDQAGSRVHVINVQHAAPDTEPLLRAVATPPPNSLWMKTAKQIEELVRERLDCVHREPAWEDIAVHVAWGVPADEITKLATGLAANLIVIGKKPQRGLVRLLLGSTADEVVRKAPCPVLVAHAPGPSVPTVTQRVA